jgi:hypothetical protein
MVAILDLHQHFTTKLGTRFPVLPVAQIPFMPKRGVVLIEWEWFRDIETRAEGALSKVFRVIKSDTIRSAEHGD